MSLRQALRDLALLCLFFGLFCTFVFTLYSYVVYRETTYVLIAFVLGLAMSFGGVAKYRFIVDFWGTIIDYWQKQKSKRRNSKDA